MFKAYKKSTGVRHNQIRYVLIGTVIAYIGGSMNYFLYYDIPIPPLGNWTLTVYAVVMTYAIVRHRLMDISVIIRKSLIYSLLVIFVSFIFVGVIFLSQALLSRALDVNQWVSAFIAAIIIALLFNPLENFLASSTDKIFFKARYDYQKTIAQVSKSIGSVIKQEELFSLLKGILKNTVKVKNAFLVDLEQRKVGQDVLFVWGIM